MLKNNFKVGDIVKTISYNGNLKAKLGDICKIIKIEKGIDTPDLLVVRSLNNHQEYCQFYFRFELYQQKKKIYPISNWINKYYLKKEKGND